MIVLSAEFEKSAPAIADAPPPDLPEICFVGRSNVGKSSALNLLAKRKQLARVSKTPGRTRLLNFFRVELADKAGPKRRTAAVRLCDLPGYGFAGGPKDERRKWGAMIGDYLDSRESLAACVLLVDTEVGPQPVDHDALELLAKAERPIIVCATKSDKLSRTRLGSALDRVARDLELPRAAIVPFSSITGAGERELWAAICGAAGIWGRSTDRLLAPGGDEPEGHEPEGDAP